MMESRKDSVRLPEWRGGIFRSKGERVNRDISFSIRSKSGPASARKANYATNQESKVQLIRPSKRVGSKGPDI